ncbi:MAG: hypothetical protein FK731_00340 [Asgard group archaeon]|nr:hypothetical protein [Asgard group archaeon]
MEGITKELQAIEKEVNSQSYVIAHRKLQALLKRKNLSKEDQIRIKILMGKNVYQLAKNQLTFLKYAEEAAIESKEIGNHELHLKALVEVARCKCYVLEYYESLELIGTIENKLEAIWSPNDIEYKKIQVALLNVKGIIYYLFFDDLVEAYKFVNKSIKTAEKLNIPYLQLESYYIMLRLKYETFDFDGFEKWVFEKIAIAEENEEEIWKAQFLIILAQVFNNTYARYDDAIYYSQKAMEIFNKYELDYNFFRHIEMMTHWYKGNLEKFYEMFKSIPVEITEEKSFKTCYHKFNHFLIEGLYSRKIGDLDKAVKCLKEVNAFWGKIKGKENSDMQILRITEIYIEQGKLSLALENAIRMNDDNFSAEGIYDDFALELFKIYILTCFSKIYYLQGSFKLAFEHTQKCIEYLTKIDYTHLLIEMLFLMIKIQFERRELDFSNEYIKQLEELANREQSSISKHTYLVGKALVLKASTNAEHWNEAINILEEIVKEEITRHALTAEAMIFLCELLVTEFSYTGDTGILQKLEKYTTELEEIAYKQNSYHIKLESTHIHLLTLWLKAQYSLADIDLEKAKVLLEKIRNMADEEGLINLAEKITLRNQDIITRIDQWAIHIKNYRDFLKE